MVSATDHFVSLSVSLISGQTADVTVDINARGSHLLELARQALSCNVTNIISSRGHQLNQNLSLANLGVFEWESITAVVGELVIFSSASAFAALPGDGRVVTWGHGGLGGDSGAVQEQLQGKVQHVFCTSGAFAAVLSGGRVVTWGDARWGGNCENVQKQLQVNVEHIYSTSGAFAAVFSCGRVVTWGGERWGGDSSGVQEQLRGKVLHVYSTGYAFAAVLGSGCVVTWGDADGGGDSRAVQKQLRGHV
eukprot:TRINITY_DN15691_c1_g1_i1.p1 TRINITY_DN15691_c1_g1~~TRINITY_DN15691_c1_g1_i1.p1  ORF type:complete len:249 (+),score=39.93 TRINITY_DN15691_c1_g1_i1:88-834(+)